MNNWIKKLLIGSYIWYLGEGMFGPLYSIFAQKIGGDVLELTAAYAVYLVASGMITIILGKISDNYSKPKLMIMGYTLNALATFGYLLVSNPLSLLIVQSILGVANALATPTWNSLYSTYVEKKRAGEQWGLSSGGPDIITAGSIIIGGFIITYLGFNALFITMGVTQVIATIVQASILKNDKISYS